MRLETAPAASTPSLVPLHVPGEPPARPRPERRASARDVLDVFIGRQTPSTRPVDAHRAFMLRDLGLALLDLGHRTRAKATVRSYDEPWEMCVERFGATACLSVYLAGPEPSIAVYDRAVSFDDLVSAARAAIDRVASEGRAGAGALLQLTSVAEQLRTLPRADAGEDVDVPAPVHVQVDADADSPLSFGAEFAMREGGAAGPDEASSPSSIPTSAECEMVERSDVHALLFRGRVRAEIRGRSVDLGECHPLLVAERLIELARRAFGAWERGLPLYARGEAGGILVGVRVGAEGDLALTLGAAPSGARRTVHTFPALGVADMLAAALAFGQSLVRAVLRRDRSQAANLRLSALRRSLRESSEALRQASQVDSKVNPTPEPYRAFAAAVDVPRPERTASLPATRLRYTPRWRAIVPGIDLRATFLCGDRIVVGAATEMWALERATGRVIWRTDVSRGTSFVTPGGIARLAPDGALRIHDLASGEPTLRARIQPRAGAPVAGAVLHLPGLPRLVIVTEGEHHLVAVDLTSGEPRWRWSWGAGRSSRRAAPRIKRSGKLVYFTCGDGALTALDVQTGAVVWRLRDRLRFRTPPTVARDGVFVVSGGAHGVARLYCVDPYSGHVRWSTCVAEPTAPCTVEGAPLVAESTVAVAIRQKSGLGLACFRLEDGAPAGSRSPAVAPSGTSWLAVDDVFIGNAPNSEVVGVDATTGVLRWRKVLGPRPLEADVPRRLEPVLRCGALFVPSSFVGLPGEGDGADHARGPAAGVIILRPSDGALLGTIAPTEAIPDLLRVDEQCNVFVAEESGQLVAFGALPRLSLVSG
jgi:outer membrane protein assembly factor BamB